MHNEEIAQSAENSVPDVWLVRGGGSNASASIEACVAGGYVGINFDLEHMDLGRARNMAEIIDFYRENLYYTPSTIAANQVSRFVFGIRIGDYVIMPELPRTRVVHYGMVRSGVYHVTDGKPNRRKIAWQGTFKREDNPALEQLCRRRPTVSSTNDKQKLAFFEIRLGDPLGERERIQNAARQIRERMSPPSPDQEHS